jgi:ATP-dependent protease ClpP protease subunit
MNLAGQLRERQAAAKPRASGKRWYDIRNAAAPDTTAVYLYDMIGDDGWGGGISAGDFVNELQGIGTGAIELHISCEGGAVWDGLAIYESLKQHPATVNVKIDSPGGVRRLVHRDGRRPVRPTPAGW